MKDQILDIVSSVSIGKNSVIPIKDVSKLFGTNKIKFQISIKENKIIIESPKILEDLDNQDRPLEPVTVNVS